MLVDSSADRVMFERTQLHKQDDYRCEVSKRKVGVKLAEWESDETDTRECC